MDVYWPFAVVCIFRFIIQDVFNSNNFTVCSVGVAALTCLVLRPSSSSIRPPLSDHQRTRPAPEKGTRNLVHTRTCNYPRQSAYWAGPHTVTYEQKQNQNHQLQHHHRH